MPRYSYTAQSFKGERKTGVLDAKDEHQLAKNLHQEGYVLISAAADGKAKKKGLGFNFSSLKRGIPLKDKIMFTRNLAVMVGAGIALPRSLRTLAAQSKKKNFSKALLQITDEITKGKSFSESLGGHSNIFPDFFVSMVKVGEEAGTLDEVLGILSGQMEKEYELRSKIQGALVYPAVIITAMMGIGVLMLIMVVPKLAATFDDLGVELPVTTRAVIGLGTFLASYWYVAIIIVVALVALARIALKTKPIKKMLDAVLIRIPVISSVIKKNNAAQTTRTLSSLISSGVPIVRALEVLAGTLDNYYFKQTILAAAEQVKQGIKLSETLEPHQDLYPPLVIQMLAVGEETGETSNILAKLAEFFEDEVARVTKNFASIVEPVLMIIIGAAVGFFAISMVQPMYSMLNTIQ